MAKLNEFKFNAGDKVQHMITNYEGIIIARTQWLNNCNTYNVKSQSLKDHQPIDSVVFDENELVLVEPRAFQEKKEEKTGGPIPKSVRSR